MNTNGLNPRWAWKDKAFEIVDKYTPENRQWHLFSNVPRVTKDGRRVFVLRTYHDQGVARVVAVLDGHVQHMRMNKIAFEEAL